jgi:hypothetical protein
MKLKPDFQIVQMANDYMLVPTGDQIDSFNGTVILNEVSAFILNQLKEDLEKEDLVERLVMEFDVESATAREDVDVAVEKMKQIGILI